MPAIVFLERSDRALTAWAVFAGVASGLIAALPTVLVLRRVSKRHAPQVAVGLICSLLGIILLQAAILLIYMLNPAMTIFYGVAATLTLLAVIIAFTLKTWRKIG